MPLSSGPSLDLSLRPEYGIVMARPLRITYEGAWYHVMNRGARRRQTFPTDAYRTLFLALLGDITETFGIEVHAYCLLDTHYHLLLHTPRGNLSRAMRHLNGVYTQRYNQQRHMDGPLFRGRFKTILVDAESYLAPLSRYIHLALNMARKGEKGLDASWSSYAAYLGRVRPPTWLYRQSILSLFGKRGARQRYQAFVESGLDDELYAFYRSQRQAPILGGEAFCTRIAHMLADPSTDPDGPEAKHLAARSTLETIIQVTAAHFGVPLDDLHRDGRGRGNLQRTVAMALGRTPGGYTLQEIADAFGVSAVSSISAACRRLREHRSHDRALRRQVEVITSQLFGDH